MYKSDRVQIRIDEEGWNWSGAFPVDKIDSFTFKLRHRVSSQVFLKI